MGCAETPLLPISVPCQNAACLARCEGPTFACPQPSGSPRASPGSSHPLLAFPMQMYPFQLHSHHPVTPAGGVTGSQYGDTALC